MHIQGASGQGPGLRAFMGGHGHSIGARPHVLKRQRSFSAWGRPWQPSETFQVEVFPVSRMLVGRVGEQEERPRESETRRMEKSLENL